MKWFDVHTHGPVKVAKGIRSCFPEEPCLNGWHSVGLHPMRIGHDWPDALEIVARRVSHPDCLAIGECGLDYRLKQPMDLQRRVFEAHIHLAQSVCKPLIIHCVRTFDALLSIKKATNTTVPLLIHGFSKHPNLAAQMVGAGFYLSFGQDLVRNPSLIAGVPAERFFLETDGRDVEIQKVYQAAALGRGESVSQIHRHIEQNFETVFNKKYPNSDL